MFAGARLECVAIKLPFKHTAARAETLLQNEPKNTEVMRGVHDKCRSTEGRRRERKNANGRKNWEANFPKVVTIGATA